MSATDYAAMLEWHKCSSSFADVPKFPTAFTQTWSDLIALHKLLEDAKLRIEVKVTINRIITTLLRTGQSLLREAEQARDRDLITDDAYIGYREA